MAGAPIMALTVAQIVEFATLEKCPKQIQDHWGAQNLDLEYVVCHAIEPNFDLAKKGQKKKTVAVVPGAGATSTIATVALVMGSRHDIAVIQPAP